MLESGFGVLAESGHKSGHKLTCGAVVFHQPGVVAHRQLFFDQDVSQCLHSIQRRAKRSHFQCALQLHTPSLQRPLRCLQRKPSDSRDSFALTVPNFESDTHVEFFEPVVRGRRPRLQWLAPIYGWWDTGMKRKNGPCQLSRRAASNGCWLKNELQRELQDALVASGQSTGPADITLNLAECTGAVKGCHRQTRVQMIRKVTLRLATEVSCLP